jgi:hypothetical protein
MTAFGANGSSDSFRRVVYAALVPRHPARRGLRKVERRGGGPERLVFGLVVAPVLEGILGDHRAGEAQLGGAPEAA